MRVIIFIKNHARFQTLIRARTAQTRPACHLLSRLQPKLGRRLQEGPGEVLLLQAGRQAAQKLVEKMEARDEMPTEATQEHSATCDDLTQIFERNGLQKAGKDSLLWQELMEWKRTKY